MTDLIFLLGVTMGLFGLVGIALYSLEWLAFLVLYISSLRREGK